MPDSRFKTIYFVLFIISHLSNGLHPSWLHLMHKFDAVAYQTR